ncbi:hypothetical protein CDAR_618301 [Caerostris darwini]|uniref:Uncharacterized protein n=1 Tax=Caerostris darwini TaxID=1538125 RepID=A0AAV4SR46_9ARAC|nr:hypothetical protein CDAR_618301 [Caerostris darwini]
MLSLVDSVLDSKYDKQCRAECFLVYVRDDKSVGWNFLTLGSIGKGRGVYESPRCQPLDFRLENLLKKGKYNRKLTGKIAEEILSNSSPLRSFSHSSPSTHLN